VTARERGQRDKEDGIVSHRLQLQAQEEKDTRIKQKMRTRSNEEWMGEERSR
jgi:hypothetical protein